MSTAALMLPPRPPPLRTLHLRLSPLGLSSPPLPPPHQSLRPPSPRAPRLDPSRSEQLLPRAPPSPPRLSVRPLRSGPPTPHLHSDALPQTISTSGSRPDQSCRPPDFSSSSDLGDLHAALYPLDHVVDRERRHRRRGHRLHLHAGLGARARLGLDLHPRRHVDGTSTNESGKGWQSGISSAVRLAAWMPAIRAVPITSPLGGRRGAPPRRSRATCAPRREPAPVARSRAWRPRRPSGRSRPRRCV